MTPILEEKGIPHRTQTAYQAGISCCDATEVVQEVVKAYINCGSMIFQCFYDLEKAFDSIKHNVLLNHLYKAGINGKAWRVIRAFGMTIDCRRKNIVIIFLVVFNLLNCRGFINDNRCLTVYGHSNYQKVLKG